jgi:nucleotide-binding universal stress UspA family protein
VFRTIVVGHGGTPGADVALRLAERLAADGATLLLARVIPAEPVLARALSHGGESSRRQAVASELEALCAGVGGTLQAVARVVTGPSAERGLVALAEEAGADLIVVGCDRRPGDFRAHTVLGLRLLRGAPCAVAIAPADPDFELHHVGVAYDGSPEAERALEAAYDVARRLHAACTIYLAVLPAAEPTLDAQQAHRQAAALLDAAAERAPAGVDPETVIVPGFPGTAIAGRVAGVIDLLVLGARRQGPLQRALMVSTSRAIGVEVDCALLITPR